MHLLRSSSRPAFVLIVIASVACGGSDDSSSPSDAAAGAAGMSSAAGSAGSSTAGAAGSTTAGAGGSATAGAGGSATAGAGGSVTAGAAGSATAGAGGSATAGASSGGAGGGVTADYPPGPYGKTVDAVFPNLSWQGYQNYTFDAVSTTKAFGPVTMNDIRKNGKKWALVTLSESYCPGCQKTATQLKDAKPVVDAGGTIVEVLITTGFIAQPAKNDLDAWIKSTDSHITVVMDPPGGGTVTKNTLGERENGFIIDLETMKIVETIKGSNSGAQPTVGEQGLAKMKARLGI